ncbi:MAG TPA: rhamnulokinase family protein [Anaerolineaceae bacterium]
MSVLKQLAFDLGAESGRAILGQFDGEKISLLDIHRFNNPSITLPDGIHWDTLYLWGEIKRGLALASHEHGKELASVGLDTWGVDFGLLDANGNLIYNPYHYRDGRTDGLVEEACKIIPRQEIFDQTGIQFLQLNSLYQLFAFVRQNAPGLQIAQTFLTMPDLLNYWLTGRKVCEFTNATTTQCYNPRTGTWAKEMVERLGIPSRIFPEIVSPGTVLGNLSNYVSEEIGSKGFPVIAPACHDTGSAVAAIPAAKPGFAWISSGTWSIMGAEVRQAVISPKALQYNFTNEGGVDGTYRLSKNIMGLWLVQESRRTWAKQGEELSYDEITRLAAEAKPLQSVIDVDWAGFGKPGDMPARIRDYCQRHQQPIPETKGAVIRCALESLALKYRWVLEKLEDLLGYRLEPLHIVGGGTKNRLLSQFTADAIGRTVITGPVEATATGNLLVQAVALGKIDSISEAREIVRHSFDVSVFEPRPGCGWDEAYERLLTLMEQAT